jgi:hypothetical protein
VSIEGVNQYKPYVTKMRLRKPIHIFQRKPTILIMGSSRAGGGLHCEDFTQKVDACYNSALRGITTYEQYRLLEHAITVADSAHKKIERVVLKISYATFTETSLTKEGFEENLAAHEDEGVNFTLRKAMLEKYLYALFSWEALSDSRITYSFQDKPYGWRATDIWSFEQDGSWRTYPTKSFKSGPELVHSNQSKKWGSSMNAIVGPFTQLKNQIDNHVDFELSYQNFSKLLDLAYRHHIPMDIMLSPEHAFYLKLLDETGLWPHTEDWKRRVVSINEQIAATHNTKPYKIWDFGGYNEYSTEASWDEIPVGQKMQWYEDIVHFQPRLGALILAAIRDNETKGAWFEVINHENIEKHLTKIRNDKDAYVKKHPMLITK